MIGISREYLAGVLDSDGSLSVTRRHLKRPNPSYTAMIQITWLYSSKSKLVFDFLQRYYGGSYYIGKSHSGFNNPKKIIKYCATGKAAHRILLDCRTSVVLKSKQVKNLLAVIDINQSTKGRRNKAAGKVLQKIYEINKDLNANP